MPDGLYERDILLWSEQQAHLMRRLAAGERVNAEIDWPNLIEEVGDLGPSELRACESLLRQALAHLLTSAARPDGTTQHRRGEISAFLADAQARCTPSMRRKLDIDALYGKARRQVIATLDHGAAIPALPATCPVRLDDLLADSFSVPSLERRFAASDPG